MSLDDLQKILSTLVEYKTCEIVHTFSKDKEPIVRLSYSLETNSFHITNLKTRESLMFNQALLAASAINELINH